MLGYAYYVSNYIFILFYFSFVFSLSNKYLTVAQLFPFIVSGRRKFSYTNIVLLLKENVCFKLSKRVNYEITSLLKFLVHC